jgi:hypothetical protein
LNDPVARNTYQHDGHQDFIMGVVDQCFMAHSLTRICAQPPGSGGTPRAANLSLELETLIRAMRDAEVLSHGAIPAACVRNRFAVEA